MRDLTTQNAVTRSTLVFTGSDFNSKVNGMPLFVPFHSVNMQKDLVSQV